MMIKPMQDKYLRVYRRRQSWVYHLAYLRLSKVLILLSALEKHGLSLTDKSILDYGFGAGTFLRHCPKEYFLFGVELDCVNVESVRDSHSKRRDAKMLIRARQMKRGGRIMSCYPGQYDLVVCSHVLEHMKERVELLKRLMSCLAPEGCLLGALPINELVPHENHEWAVDRSMIGKCVQAAGAKIVCYWELDHFTYYALPVFHAKSAFGRFMAQGTSLCLGIVATLLGMRLWFMLSTAFGRATRAKPAQAVFLLRSQTTA